MKTKKFLRNSRRMLASAGSIAALAATINGAPTITRLTPPSALFTFDDAEPPFISRFVEGQFFDLQVTAYPSPGTTITGVEFRVDDVPVSGKNPSGAPISYSPAVTTGLTANLTLSNGST